MRINYLRMRNFSPIYYSLDKEEILLDCSGDKEVSGTDIRGQKLPKPIVICSKDTYSV